MTHSPSTACPTLSRRKPHTDPVDVPPNAHRDAPDPAVVIGLSLKFARLHGRKRAALPFAVAGWLMELVEAGDPTCRLVLDWLEGDERSPITDGGRPRARRRDRAGAVNGGRR
jgi:hypothetical protein